MATINEVLTKVNELKPNQYDDGLKIKWLSNLEYRNVQEIFDTHEYNDGEEEPDFSGYTEADFDTELLTPEPYSEMYAYYLYAMIDFSNGETDRYQNSMMMFNSQWSAWSNYYNRKHLPKTTALKL